MTAGRKPVFRLYVSGATPKSVQAITNLRSVLDGLYEGGYELEVIDIYQEPQMASDARISAVPMLTREYPLPVLRRAGNFSSIEHIRRMLSASHPHGSPDERDG